jgi:hypothetical protein
MPEDPRAGQRDGDLLDVRRFVRRQDGERAVRDEREEKGETWKEERIIGIVYQLLKFTISVFLPKLNGL